MFDPRWGDDPHDRDDDRRDRDNHDHDDDATTLGLWRRPSSQAARQIRSRVIATTNGGRRATATTVRATRVTCSCETSTCLMVENERLCTTRPDANTRYAARRPERRRSLARFGSCRRRGCATDVAVVLSDRGRGILEHYRDRSGDGRQEFYAGKRACEVEHDS